MGRSLKIRGIHRRILGYLARGDPIPFVIHNTNLSRHNFYKKLHTLERHGYVRITRVGKVLDVQLQPLAVKELGIVSVGAKKVNYIDLHDVWVACRILRKPVGWENRGFVERILEMRSIDHSINRPRNWRGVFFDYASVTVRVTPNKVMFNPPHIEVSTMDEPEHAKNLIMKHIDGVVPKIENMFGVKLTKPSKVSMSVSSQHIAFVKNLMAKYFIDKEIDLRVYDGEGRLRVIVDKSHGPELETVSKVYAEEDAERLDTLIKDTVLGRFDHRQVTRDLSETARIVRRMAENQEVYSKELVGYGREIAMHRKSIGDLGDGVRRLTALISRLDVAKSGGPKHGVGRPVVRGKMRRYWRRLAKVADGERNQRRLGDFCG